MQLITGFIDTAKCSFICELAWRPTEHVRVCLDMKKAVLCCYVSSASNSCFFVEIFVCRHCVTVERVGASG
jgi:hypothetical protein